MSSPKPAASSGDERGVALILVIMLLALMMTMLLGYFTLVHIGMSSQRNTKDSLNGLYVAEAGLNIRAEAVRLEFEGYNVPSGTGPDPANPPCVSGNNGSGDMACVNYTLIDKTATTYLVEAPGNPGAIVVPRGELYQNLNAQEYTYTVDSVTKDSQSRPHAILSLQFKSRLIPMFQFAAFYDKDLEILPGANMTLGGPIHVNGDLYVGCNATLQIDGQITTSGHLYRGRKDENLCLTGPVQVMDPEDPTGLPACSGTRKLYTQAQLNPWNGMIQTGVEPVEVPEPEMLDAVPGAAYWDHADVRVVLDVHGTPTIQVRNPDDTVDTTATTALAGCGATSTTNTMYNHREATLIRMLEVDVRGLLNCLHTTTIMGGTKDIDETSEGGLVWHFSVDGPDSATINNYGVRLKTGGTLASNVIGAPAIKGLTVVTDQAIYIKGNYNSTSKKPAAILADSLNVLSNAWTTDPANSVALSGRVATNTTINAAFLAGTDTTGGAEGAGGQSLYQYNGGLENYPRLHEKWSSATLTYRGSWVSLDRPRHVDGAWVYGGMFYEAPTRDWGYDTDFDDAENLPPMSPRFVYLKQRLFLREFKL